MNGLNKKQEMFAQLYVKSGNMADAYRQAYQSKSNSNTVSSNACRLLKNERVSQRVAELREEASKGAVAEISEIFERLTKIARMETTEEVVVVEGCGDGMSEARVIEKKPSVKDAINAMNSLLKCKGAFKNDVNVNVSVPVIGGEDDIAD